MSMALSARLLELLPLTAEAPGPYSPSSLNFGFLPLLLCLHSGISVIECFMDFSLPLPRFMP